MQCVCKCVWMWQWQIIAKCLVESEGGFKKMQWIYHFSVVFREENTAPSLLWCKQLFLDLLDVKLTPINFRSRGIYGGAASGLLFI